MRRRNKKLVGAVALLAFLAYASPVYVPPAISLAVSINWGRLSHWVLFGIILYLLAINLKRYWRQWPLEQDLKWFKSEVDWTRKSLEEELRVAREAKAEAVAAHLKTQGRLDAILDEMGSVREQLG